MGRRGNKKGGRGRRRQDGRRGTESLVRRHATEIGLGLGVLALVVSVVAIWPAVVSNEVLQNTDLTVAEVTVGTRDDVAATNKDGTGLHEDRATTVDVAAAAITVRNSGEEPALLTRLRVLVDRVWMPASCAGGGPGLTEVTYDFVLRGDVDTAPKPAAQDKEIRFAVGGKAIEQLTVTIGQEVIGETGWPWLIAARVELVQDNGETVRTEPFVLMDHYPVDGIVASAAFFMTDSDVDNDFHRQHHQCVGDNVRLLEEVLALAHKRSSAIGELRERLVRLGYHSSATAPSSRPPPPPGEEAADSWVAQLASLPRSTPVGDVERHRVRIAEETGFGTRVLDSSDFASLTPGYWVIYAPGNFADGHAVLDACRARGRTAEHSCVGRYLSHSPSDQDLVCRFSDSPGSPHCVRES